MPSQPQQGMMKITELQVNPEYEALLPPLLDEELKNLENSILEDGILHSFIINPNKVVLDGHHRLLICKRHAINEVPFIERSFNTDIKEIEFVISFNLNRRHLTITQKVELGMTFHKIEMVKAKERQAIGHFNAPQYKDKPVPRNSEELDEERGEAIEIAAKKVGLGKDTFRKGKRIAEAAQTDKHVYTAWRDIADGNRSIDSVYEELFHQEKPPTSSRRPPRSSSIPKIEGVFQVIVIDLPITKLEKLKEIINSFDEKNCVLWLWIPFKSLLDAFKLLHHYRFQPQTMLTWVKNKKGSGKWLRKQTEYCILATRGKPVANLTYQSTAIIASSGKHNSKPDEFYLLVESLFTDGKKLNVSSSMIKRPGWEEPSLEADANAV